jgi:DinB family protein
VSAAVASDARHVIEPDTKDWTWVLTRPCPECGLDARTIAREDVPAILRRNARAWPAVLDGDAARRAHPDRWSPLEYACHVRDVHRVYTTRLHLMNTRDDPHYPNWDQDATAVQQRYAEQDPATGARELTAAAEVLARAFEQVSDWTRTGNRSDGARFTIETFARYLVHDPVHHLWDVTGVRAEQSAGQARSH